MADSMMVGLAEVKVCTSPGGVLVALGLGSCIGVCVYDPQTGVAGLAHIVLPSSGGETNSPGKYADTAIPLLLERVEREGAAIRRLRVALAGGAQLFNFNGSNGRLEIGARNIQAVQEILASKGMRVMASDLGGSVGRTVHFHQEGQIRVKSIGQGEKELINLSAAGLEFAGLRRAA